jgi:sterol desaturase/sphingolipid hydroxylase (fatty acid hydroxylase superfamily)
LFHFVIFPILLSLDTFVLKSWNLRLDAESYPSHFEIITQVIFFMLVEDFFFYWAHRLLHHPKLYPHIHKRHHEYVNSVSICAEYAHPIENVLANMVPTSIGMILLGNKVHYITWSMWLIIRVAETSDGHSGYEFSWSPFRLLPLSGSAKYHDFHHTNNLGNYGSFFIIWDTLMSTNKAYFRHLAKKELSESISKQQQPARANFLEGIPEKNGAHVKGE